MKIKWLIPLMLSLASSLTLQAEANTRIQERDHFGNRTGKRHVLKKGQAIYETSRSGRIRYDRPSWVIEGDKVYERDRFGNKTGKRWRVK